MQYSTFIHAYHSQPPQLFFSKESILFSKKNHQQQQQQQCKFLFKTHSISIISPLLPLVSLTSCKQHHQHNPDLDATDRSLLTTIPNHIHIHIHIQQLASWLRSCYTIKEALILHSTIIKSFGLSHTFLLNNLITVYLKLGKLSEARKVFDQMSHRNVVSWTAILNGYFKLGSEDIALSLFIELISNGIEPNSKTFVCVLNLCSKMSDFEFGKQIHACIIKGPWRNLIVDSSIVYFYAQCGDITATFRAFEKMPQRDVITWTSLISACAEHGHAVETFSLFSKMQSEGIRPNEYTVSSVLKACAVEKNLKVGRQLHAPILKRMFKDDVFVGTALLSMYVKCEDVPCARAVFNGMKKRNTVTWTSMITGYTQNGFGEDAIALFRLMKTRHIYANYLTVVSILGACGSVGASSMGKEVHAQILKNSIETSMYVGSTLVWFYCKCKEYRYAANVLELMPRRDVVSWTAMISGCARLGHASEALKFMNEMLQEGVEPNPFTYSCAIKACSKLEAILQGKSIHSCVEKTRAFSNVFVASALIDMYLKCGSVSEAIRIFDTMPERNLVSWKTMVVGYAKNGLCREALQLMYRMQAEGIKVDDYTQTTILNACGDVQLEFYNQAHLSLEQRNPKNQFDFERN